MAKVLDVPLVVFPFQVNSGPRNSLPREPTVHRITKVASGLFQEVREDAQVQKEEEFLRLLQHEMEHREQTPLQQLLAMPPPTAAEEESEGDAEAEEESEEEEEEDS